MNPAVNITHPPERNRIMIIVVNLSRTSVALCTWRTRIQIAGPKEPPDARNERTFARRRLPRSKDIATPSVDPASPLSGSWNQP